MQCGDVMMGVVHRLGAVAVGVLRQRDADKLLVVRGRRVGES